MAPQRFVSGAFDDKIGGKREKCIELFDNRHSHKSKLVPRCRILAQKYARDLVARSGQRLVNYTADRTIADDGNSHLSTKICLQEIAIAPQGGRRVGRDNPARLENIGIVRNRKRIMHILLDE